MEGSAAVVLVLTLVLVLAVLAALFVFVISPSIEEDGGDGEGDGDGEGEHDVDDVVRGINSALRSGYEHDEEQDGLLEEGSNDREKQRGEIESNREKIDALESRLEEQAGLLEEQAARPSEEGPGPGWSSLLNSEAASAMVGGLGAAAGAYLADIYSGASEEGPEETYVDSPLRDGGEPRPVDNAFATDPFAETLAGV